MGIIEALIGGLCVAIPNIIATVTTNKKKREIPSSSFYLGLNSIIK